MAKDQTVSSPFVATFAQMRALAAANPLARSQAAHVLETQDLLLDEWEAFSNHWFQRRHVATTTAMETAQKVLSNGLAVPQDSLDAITDWQKHSFERVVEDCQEWIDVCNRCAEHIARNSTEAGAEVIEETAKLTGGTKREHSTPV